MNSDGSGGVTMEQYFTPMFLIIISVLGVCLIVVIMVLILVCHRLYKRRQGYNRTDTAEVNIDLDKLPSNMAYHRLDFIFRLKYK